jgi:class 3 adenylate cyclase/tetratricopeptide (TPR) repeat protein
LYGTHLDGQAHRGPRANSLARLLRMEDDRPATRFEPRRWCLPMQCSSCGHPNPADARFCAECGHALFTPPCPACGAQTRVGQKFCSACGAALIVAPAMGAAASATATAPDLRTFTPAHLAQKIRAGQAMLEGERKQVTVLFADVKGSMDLASSIDPEDWQRIMGRFFGLMCEGIHRFEGTVDKFTGDGIMALFGAPIAHEDHARRACYAALHLRDELARYTAELRRTEGRSFSVRMGINSGEVVVGTIGDDLSLEYTAIGHTVGLAQRMEALAEPGKIYVTEDTAALITGYFDLSDLGRFDIKGVRRPVNTFELAGVGALRTSLEVARARGFSRFVGRDAEMRLLDEHLERALEGHGSVVGLVAEPGVGKSRLCFEFAQRCRARDIDVWEAHALAHAKAVPFVPVLEILRSFFGIADQDDDASAREKVAGRLLLLDEAFKDSLAVIFEFLGVADPERPAPPMDPQARQRLLLAAVQRLVRRRSDRGPGMILVEDLHWLDPGSEAFLENLIAVVPETRTLVVVNFRPEYDAPWMRQAYYRHVPLVPLGEAASEELLRELLGGDPSLDGLSELIGHQTGGNPFFIEEVVQGLADEGTLEGVKGDYRLAHTVEHVTIPPTVQAVLAARIDRLPARDKRVLQAAAVIGRRFVEPVLRRVARVEDDDDLRAALRELVDAEFVYEESLYPEAEYVFKHPLTEEIAYRTQLGEARARVHAAVAATLADLYPDRHDENAALLAHHWERAGDALQAANWSARAAFWAGFNDPSEALRHWRKVRDLIDTLPESPETAPLALGARIQILNLAWRLGGAVPEAETAATFAAAKELAERVGDRRSLAILIISHAGIKGLGGASDEYVAGALEALRIAEDLGDDALQMVIAPPAIYSLFIVGRLHDALARAERAIALCANNPTLGAGVVLRNPYAWCTWYRGWLRMILGDLTGAREDHDRALRLARAHGDIETEGWTHMGYVSLARHVGDPDGGLAHAMRTVEIAEHIGDSFSRGWGHTYLGLAHLLREEWDDAIAALEHALNISRTSGTGREGEPYRLGLLALALGGLGERDRAPAVAREAVELARARGTRYMEVEASLALGRVLLAVDVCAARRALDAALALTRELGLGGVEPFVHVARAQLARQCGDDEACAQEVRAARRLFEKTGAHAQAAKADLLADGTHPAPL